MHACCHLSLDAQHVTITDRVVTIYVSLMAPSLHLVRRSEMSAIGG
jgi:hypothetical protein